MVGFRVLWCLVVVSVILLQNGPVQAGQLIGPADVVSNTDKEKHTSAEIKKYIASLKGQQFSASGKVQDVQTGRSGYKVVVNAEVPGRTKRFVVDVYTKDGAKFRKGNHVSCKGTIVKFNRFTYSGIGMDCSCS